MDNSRFKFLPEIKSDFATKISDSSGDRKHEDATMMEKTITDATIQSLRSRIEYLEKRLVERNATINNLKKKVENQESTIRYCFTKLETRNVYDAKTESPRHDINAGPGPDAGPHNPVQVVPISIMRVHRDCVVDIALKNVSCVPRSSQ